MWPFKPKAAGNGDYSDTSGLDSTTARIWVDYFGATSAKSGATVDAFLSALAEAGFARDTVGVTQKALRAEVTIHDPAPTRTNRFRWARRPTAE